MAQLFMFVFKKLCCLFLLFFLLFSYSFAEDLPNEIIVCDQNDNCTRKLLDLGSPVNSGSWNATCGYYGGAHKKESTEYYSTSASMPYCDMYAVDLQPKCLDWDTDSKSCKTFQADKKVIAIFNGKVEKAETAGSYGKTVLINHGFIDEEKKIMLFSRYAHLEKMSVKKDDEVKRGDEIGIAGSTGGDFPLHLHFAMYKVNSSDNISYALKPSRVAIFPEGSYTKMWFKDDEGECQTSLYRYTVEGTTQNAKTLTLENEIDEECGKFKAAYDATGDFLCILPDGKCQLSTTYIDVEPGRDFIKKWLIKNVGTNDWSLNEIDFVYWDKAGSGNTSQLSIEGWICPEPCDVVKNNTSQEFAVTMQAPDEIGKYSEKWVLKKTDGSVMEINPLGYVTVDINVVEPSNCIFPDVCENNPFYDAIAKLSSMKVDNEPIVRGYTDGLIIDGVTIVEPGHFGPDHTINRAEFSKILFKLAQAAEILKVTKDATSGKVTSITDLDNQEIYMSHDELANQFTDIPESEKWYEVYLGPMNKLKVIEGYEGGTFKPEKTIVRSEILKMVTAMFFKDSLREKTEPWFLRYKEKAEEVEISADNIGIKFIVKDENGIKKFVFLPEASDKLMTELGKEVTRKEACKIAIDAYEAYVYKKELKQL